MGTERDGFLGQILVKNLLAQPADIQKALEIQTEEQQAGKAARPLGRILVELGIVTPLQLNRVLEEQRRRAGMNKLGGYEIISRLGEGGMGAVYKGRETQSGRFVAIKVLNRRYAENAGFLARFRREATVGRDMDHGHIVRTLNFGEERGNHFIALELMDGGDLGKQLKSRGVFPEKEALEIVRAVAAALQYAHERELVHRDVKPSNVMFGADGSVKLSDFGLVKSTDPEASHLTVTGAALGTPHYIAPEQALGGQDVDIRADLYALGATLYHLVTGRPPFEGSTPLEVIQKHLNEKLTPPDELNPQVSDGCVALIDKLMAKSREDRYATPAWFLADVDRVLGGQEPVSAALEEGKSTVKISERRQEALRLRSSRPHSTRRVVRVQRKQGAPLLWGAGAMAAVLLLGALFFLPSGDDPPPPAPVSRKVAAAPASPNVPPPKPPPVNPEVTPESREEEAQVALATVMRFDGLAAGDRDGRVARLNAFIAEYGETFASARARSLLKTLETPGPTPRPPSPPPVAVIEPPPVPVVHPTPPAPKPEGPRVNDPERWRNAVDLLAIMDPVRDSVSGRWQIRSREGLLSELGMHNIFEFPYLPPDEYDFRIIFTPLRGTPDINQILTAGDSAFLWLLGGYGNTTFAFGAWDGRAGRDHPSAVKRTACFQNGRRYEAIVQVRRGRVTTWLDGERILSVETDYRNFGVPGYHTVRNPSHLGFVAYECEVMFHDADVIEISGRGAIDLPAPPPPAPDAPPAAAGPVLNVGDVDAQGWVCLFNGRDTNGWMIPQGDVRVVDGAVVLTDSGEIATDIPQLNFEVRGEVRIVKNGTDHCGGIGFRRAEPKRVGPNVLFCNDGDIHYWNTAIRSRGQVAKAGAGSLELASWQPFRLRVLGQEFTLEVDGKRVMTAPVEERSPSTLMFYDANRGAGSHIEFRNLWGRGLGADGEPGEIPADAITLFGPGGPSGGVKWRAGRDALRRVRGEAPFLDGSRRVTFETGGGQLGLTGNACYWLGYTAERDCEVYVVLRIQKFGRIARTLRLPAGTSRRIDIPITEELLGSGKSNRRITSFGIEPKGIKPGELRILRLFKTGELAE